MANGHGGSRNGAGRKRSAVRELLDAAALQAEQQITERLPSLIANMLVLADGVRLQREDEDGNAMVYTEKPDRAANEYLINRVMGKPTEKQDVAVSGKVDAVLTIADIRKAIGMQQ